MSHRLKKYAELRRDGCVRLGSEVTCDGFSPDYPIRIQTHVHSDHMAGFDSSKKVQKKIVVSEPTFDLLAVDHEDIKFRRPQFEICPVDGTSCQILGRNIRFYPSGHIIGGMMPVVEEEGKSIMYSSDFASPFTLLPDKVDVLVIDASYGDPYLLRSYTRQEVANAFIDAMLGFVARGPVVITGYRGRLQYAYQLVKDLIPGPYLFSKHVQESIGVYAKWQGFDVDGVSLGTRESWDVIKDSDRFIAFVETRDREQLVGLDLAKKVWLTQFNVCTDEPVSEYSNGLVKVSLTDHADFNGTIDLIRAVNPSFVFCDGSRGGDSDTLASYVRNELQIPATSEIISLSEAWGG